MLIASFVVTAPLAAPWMVSVAAAADATTSTLLAVGEKAPLFKAYTIEGKPFVLGDQLAEKGVALFFWSLFCSPCREEMPLIQKTYLDMKDQPVEFVGVNLDEPALLNATKSYLKSQSFSYPIVMNKSGTEDAQTDKLYKITATPALYMIRKDGTISYAHLGRLEIEDFVKAVKTHLLAPAN
jgi:peroxiredoxin